MRWGVGADDWKHLAYWICFLSNNQWDIESELGHGDLTQTSFYLALRSGHCRSTCMVLDADAWPLTRTWCIFEVLQTFELLNSSIFANFNGLSLLTSRGVLGDPAAHCYDVALGLARRLSTLSVENATAGNEHDDATIKGMVKNMAGGFDAMDSFVRTNMREVMHRVQANFHTDVANIGRSLEAKPRAQGAGDGAPTTVSI